MVDMLAYDAWTGLVAGPLPLSAFSRTCTDLQHKSLRARHFIPTTKLIWEQDDI